MENMTKALTKKSRAPPIPNQFIIEPVDLLMLFIWLPQEKNEEPKRNFTWRLTARNKGFAHQGSRAGILFRSWLHGGSRNSNKLRKNKLAKHVAHGPISWVSQFHIYLAHMSIHRGFRLDNQNLFSIYTGHSYPLSLHAEIFSDL